jgi:hypothetical protein
LRTRGRSTPERFRHGRFLKSSGEASRPSCPGCEGTWSVWVCSDPTYCSGGGGRASTMFSGGTRLDWGCAVAATPLLRRRRLPALLRRLRRWRLRNPTPDARVVLDDDGTPEAVLLHAAFASLTTPVRFRDAPFSDPTRTRRSADEARERRIALTAAAAAAATPNFPCGLEASENTCTLSRRSFSRHLVDPTLC